MDLARSVPTGPFGASVGYSLVGLLTLGVGIEAERAEAQGRESRSGYTGFFAAGVSGISTGELNNRLAASGHPTFATTGRAFNIGAYRLLRSGLMLGGEWHYITLGDQEHEGRAVGLGAGYATLGIGYAVRLSPRVRFYPRLGLGVGGMGLWTEDENDGETHAVDFDGWLANPNGDPDQSTLSQGSMAVDLGAGAELLLGRRGANGPLLGLRVGYLATPFDRGWTLDGRSVSGAPAATVAGPYARVVIGWRREQR